MDDNKKNNIHILEGGNAPNKIKDQIKIMQSNMDDLLEYVRMVAELQRAKFNALLKEDFNRQEALELTKQIF